IERITITSGGATRFDSVKNGLRLVPIDSMVFVHDGVRCLVSAHLIQRCLEAALLHGNAIPAIAPADSIRMKTRDGSIPIDRDQLRLIQTPQTFRSALLKKAYAQEFKESFTDDASVLEAIGGEINLVEGESTNIKITLPFDMVLAEMILSQRS
ncbi:MAG: 2-C-methyl-D-erythritol 4-phosphate cytidylyltransferase, partial [Chitinophagaceae bacterium]